jgi:hypothetical protein
VQELKWMGLRRFRGMFSALHRGLWGVIFIFYTWLELSLLQ